MLDDGDGWDGMRCGSTVITYFSSHRHTCHFLNSLMLLLYPDNIHKKKALHHQYNCFHFLTLQVPSVPSLWSWWLNAIASIKLIQLDNDKESKVLMCCSLFVHNPLPYFNHLVRIFKQLQSLSQH